MSWLIVISLIIILIAFNALYVAGEFATISARRSRLAQLADEESSGSATMLLPFLEDVSKLDTYVAACQIGITLSSLLLGYYGQASLSPILAPLLSGPGWLSEAAAATVAATAVLAFLTTLQVVLGELVPKNIGVQYPERLALLAIRPVRLSMLFFRPLIWFFNGSGRLLLRAMGINESAEHAHVHAPEEILLLVEESSAGGLLEDEEKRLLENTLRLRDLTVRQVMIPRTRMVAASVTTSTEELLHQLAESPYSRVPLYEESIDSIVGMVHLKDLLCLDVNQGRTELVSIMREIEFVFENAPVEELFGSLQASHHSVAIVLDEYGGTAGMVTLEDLIEEIFGEFQDEFDIEVPVLQIQSDNRIVVRGDTLVSDLNDWLDLYLEHSEVDTIGGLILSRLGGVPEVKDELTIDEIDLRIERMDGNGVAAVSLVIPADKARQVREERL